MTAKITQYLMPFGAFEHDSEKHEPPGYYSRTFDCVHAEIIRDCEHHRDTIKFDVHSGIKMTTFSGIEVNIPASEHEFFRVFSDYLSIDEIPEDITVLKFKFENCPIEITVFPHEYSKLAAEIYVPTENGSLEITRIDKDLWNFFLDFCRVMDVSEDYLKYGQTYINL